LASDVSEEQDQCEYQHHAVHLRARPRKDHEKDRIPGLGRNTVSDLLLHAPFNKQLPCWRILIAMGLSTRDLR